MNWKTIKNIDLGKWNLTFVILAIVMQTWVRYTNTRMGSDQMVQIATARSFLQGHGFTLSMANPEDLSEVISKPLTSWPYGYALFMSPFLKLTGGNFVLADLILAFLAFSVLFFSIYGILLLIRKKIFPLLFPAVFIFWALAFTPFRHGHVPDIFSLGLYFLAFYLSMILVRNINSYSALKKYGLAVLIGIAAFSCSFMRYAYYPFTLMFGIAFLLLAAFHNKRYIKFAVIILIVSVGLIAWQYNLSSYSASTAERLTSGETSLNGWILISPMFFNSFFSDYTVYSFILQAMHTGTIPFIVYLLIVIASVLICSCIFIAVISYLNRTNFWSMLKQKIEEFDLIVLFLTGTILLNLLFFGYLYLHSNINLNDYLDASSLYRYHSVKSRYFMLLLLSSQILVFLFVFKINNIGKIIKKTLSLLLIISFLFNISHWMYLRSKFSLVDRSANMYEMNKPFGSIAEFNKISEFISKRDIPVIYVPSAEETKRNYRQLVSSYFAMGTGCPAIGFDEIRNSNLFSSENIEILIPVYPDEQDKILFCRKYKAEKVLSLENTGLDIYRLKIENKEQ